MKETKEVVSCQRCDWQILIELLEELPTVCPDCGKSHFRITEEEVEVDVPDHLLGREEDNADFDIDEKVMNRKMDEERHDQV